MSKSYLLQIEKKLLSKQLQFNSMKIKKYFYRILFKLLGRNFYDYIFITIICAILRKLQY